MKTGLFFGSFNPVHIGHLIIANYMVEFTELDRVWLVVSPQNPFKLKSSLLNEYDRLHLVQLALEDSDTLSASDVEFHLPRPSYTIDTLTHLREKYPEQDFSLVMGSDNLMHFHKWKNHEVILKHHDLYVYFRKDYRKVELEDHPKVHLKQVPLLDISASFVRQHIKAGKSMRYFLPDQVFNYIEEMGFYRN